MAKEANQRNNPLYDYLAAEMVACFMMHPSSQPAAALGILMVVWRE